MCFCVLERSKQFQLVSINRYCGSSLASPVDKTSPIPFLVHMFQPHHRLIKKNNRYCSLYSHIAIVGGANYLKARITIYFFQKFLETMVPRNRNCRKILQSQHTMTFQIQPHYVRLIRNQQMIRYCLMLYTIVSFYPLIIVFPITIVNSY